MVRLPSLPSKAAMAAPFASGAAFKEWCRAPREMEGHVRIGNERWSNKDLEPTPPEQRTWHWYSMPAFWFSTVFGTTGWNVASSLIATGLTWQQAFISCIIGSAISGLIVVGMARPGVQYHVGYPVLARSVMGMYGSYFFVFIRAVVCIVWYGIQTFYGANFISVMFRCMFGQSWVGWANGAIPASANVTAKQLLGFFIVWLIQFPFMFVHPAKIHYLYTVKSIIMPFVTFGLFGWCMANGTGLATINNTSAAGLAKANTTQLVWSVMNGINVIMGSLSPMLVNQPDLARYCKKPWHAGVLQGFSVFFTKIIVFFLGLAATASIQGVWGKAYWNLWDLLDAILDHYWTGPARFAVWLVACSFLFSVFGGNFGANSTPFGADLTGLFPKYMTIRRGQILCSILGVAIVPWQIIANAQKFLSFLGSYNIFMAPLCAVIIVDYYCRGGNIHVPSLYNGAKGSLYWFTSGVNWIGVFAWCGGAALGIPGLIAQYSPDVVSEAGKNMYTMGWILTFATSSVVYYVCVLFWKRQVYPVGMEDTPRSWEYLAVDGREGFFDGERDGTVVVGVAGSTGSSISGEHVHAGEKGAKVSKEHSVV